MFFNKEKKNVIEYLESSSYKELQELKKEIVTILNLNKEKIAEKDSTRFIPNKNTIFFDIIDVVKEIEDTLKQMNRQGDIDSIITGLVQLIKTETLIAGHLKSASFYKKWVTKGYLTHIEANIKSPY